MGRPVTRWLGAIALALGSTLAMGCQGESRPVVPSAVRPMLMVAGGAGENGAYFNGRLYTWTFPSSKGSDQRELVFGCFRVGVDMIDRAQPRARLYALFCRAQRCTHALMGRTNTTTFSARCQDRRATQRSLDYSRCGRDRTSIRRSYRSNPRRTCSRLSRPARS